jgi:hypothetical protein
MKPQRVHLPYAYYTLPDHRTGRELPAAMALMEDMHGGGLQMGSWSWHGALP